MRYKWIQDVIRPERPPLLEASSDTGIIWLWQQFLAAQTQVRELVTKYKHDPEGAIVKAAESLGMTHAELIQRASAIEESQLNESWFDDLMSWWSTRISTFITGLQRWTGSSMTIVCTIIAVTALGCTTLSSIPFLTKLVVWLYAYYLVDKQGRVEHG
jgi:hypothetical protein